MSFRGKLANVLEAFWSLLLGVFMAPSLVLLGRRRVCPQCISTPAQLTGWDLIATVRSAGGIHLFRVHSHAGRCTKVPAAGRTAASVGTDTVSRLTAVRV